MVMTRSERHREAARTCDLSSETRTRVHRCSRPNMGTPSERGIRNPTIRAAASGAPTERRRKVCCPSVASEPPSKRACISPIEDTSLHDVAETKSSVSDSESSSKGTSLDEVAESDSSISLTLSPTKDAEAVDEILPSRLFATDRYPRNGKVNSYSKPQYLLDILTILDGTPEMEILMQSSFKSLFSLAVRRCSLSGKLLHNMLCRQIVTNNPEEIWFTFGGHPFRFSLVEFEKVTGLPCGPYPDQQTIDDEQCHKEGSSPYWETLLGSDGNVTIDGIVQTLKAEPGMCGWKKLRLVLIVIVEGILICGTQPIRPSTGVVEMVKNLAFFFSFPWGRLAFDRTVRMLTVGTKIRKRSTIIKKLKQKSLVVHGFPIAIQLMIFDIIPLLLRYLPSYDMAYTFSDRMVSVMPTLKTYHTNNILLVENDEQLRVEQIIIPTATELSADRSTANMADPKVTYLLNLIHGGYCFRKSDWAGGDDSLDKLCICKKTKHAPCKCGSLLSYDEKEEAGEGTCSGRGVDSSSQVAKLWAEVARLKKSKSASFGKLRVSLISEIKSLIYINNCLRSSPSVDTFNIKLPSSGFTELENVGDQTSDPVGPSSNIQTIAAVTEPIDPLSAFSLSNHGTGVSNSNYLVRVTDVDSVSQISPSKRLYLANLRRPPNDLHFNDHISEKAIIPSSCEVKDTMGHQVGKHYASCTTLIAQRPVLLPTSPTVTSGTLDPSNLPNPECAPRIQPPNSDPVDHSADILYIPLHCGYVPFHHLPPYMSLKFKHQLQKYKKSSYDIDGCEVWNTFFSEIYTPQCSLFQTHMDFMLRSFWGKCGSHLAARNIGVVDSLLTQLLSAQYSTFLQAYKPSAFVWHPLLASYVEGSFGDRVGKTIWFKDVHTVYTPMHWGNRHWVGLVISLNTWHIDILDPLVKETSASMVRSYMAPLVNMLPHLIMATCDPRDIQHVDQTMFSYSRFQPVAQNTRGGDSGVYAMKFIEMHSHGYDLNHLSHITTVMVDNFRMQYAMDVYIEFIGNFCG